MHDDEAAEATRKIVCALCDVDLNLSLTAPVLRQAIFYVWEGGEAGKWRMDRAYSTAARKIRAVSIDRRLLRYDHAIPLATIRQRLREARHSQFDFKIVLQRYIKAAIITADEDALLSKKFRRTMPTDSAPDDAMARYRAVGILFDPQDESLLASAIF